MYKLMTSANCGYSYQCKWYIEVDHKPEIDYNPGGII